MFPLMILMFILMFNFAIARKTILINISCWAAAIEIIDIECVLLSFLSKKIVSATKWRIEKGILVGPRLLRQGILRGCRECELFFSTEKFAKKFYIGT
jgi:hypothetical protein